MSTFNHRRFFSMLCMLITIPATQLQAGGFNNPDTGPRRNGMFSITARPDDTTAIMHNIAGLADQRGNRLFVSGMSAFLGMEIQLHCEPWMQPYDNLGECPADVADYPGNYTPSFEPERTFGLSPFIGGSVDLTDYVDNLVAGGAIYAPNFIGAFLSDDRLSRFFGIETYFLTLMGTGAVSYRPNKYISLGLGASYMYVLFQSWKRMDLGIDEVNIKFDGTDHTMQFHAGILLDPVSWLSIGASINTHVDMEVEGDILVADSDGDVEQDSFLELTHSTKMVVPLKLTTGINIHPTDWFEIGFDYYFWRYSVFKRQETTLIYPDNIEPGIQSMLDNLDLSQPRNYKNSHAINMGARFLVPWIPIPFYAMCGLQYDWNPAPEEYLTLEAPYSDIYGFALGFDSQPLPWMRVGVAWIHNEFADIFVDESLTIPPSNAKATAHNNELSVAFQFIF